MLKYELEVVGGVGDGSPPRLGLRSISSATLQKCFKADPTESVTVGHFVKNPLLTPCCMKFPGWPQRATSRRASYRGERRRQVFLAELHSPYMLIAEPRQSHKHVCLSGEDKAIGLGPNADRWRALGAAPCRDQPHTSCTGKTQP